ncbi:hypothetical protein HBB16_09700 [Pseudonocardia sp. MCCB 268]|nr:hypothetical protein [Pseudonocardia cytotoxica]
MGSGTEGGARHARIDSRDPGSQGGGRRPDHRRLVVRGQPAARGPCMPCSSGCRWRTGGSPASTWRPRHRRRGGRLPPPRIWTCRRTTATTVVNSAAAAHAAGHGPGAVRRRAGGASSSHRRRPPSTRPNWWRSTTTRCPPSSTRRRRSSRAPSCSSRSSASNLVAGARSAPEPDPLPPTRSSWFGANGQPADRGRADGGQRRRRRPDRGRGARAVVHISTQMPYGVRAWGCATFRCPREGAGDRAARRRCGSGLLAGITAEHTATVGAARALGRGWSRVEIAVGEPVADAARAGQVGYYELGLTRQGKITGLRAGARRRRRLAGFGGCRRST